jgi:hypothetical protein
MRAFKAILGPTFDQTISTYSYGLIHFAASAVNRGTLSLKVLMKALVDPKQPFWFIGARIIANIRQG